MKAKIKQTGEIIELDPYVYDIDGHEYFYHEIEFINENDNESDSEGDRGDC